MYGNKLGHDQIYGNDLGLRDSAFLCQSFCGMSVVRDFSRLLRYNIHRLCHPEEEQENSGKKQGVKNEEAEEAGK